MNPTDTGAIDPRLKKRMLMFYLAGIFNAVIGVYILLEGRKFLPEGTVLLLVVFFLVFAAVDFYFPRLMKRKWLEHQAQLAAQKNAAEQQK
jgi:hypothetical protein